LALSGGAAPAARPAPGLRYPLHRGPGERRGLAAARPAPGPLYPLHQARCDDLLAGRSAGLSYHHRARTNAGRAAGAIAKFITTSRRC